MPPATNPACLDPEELAALIDGGLGVEERSRVVEHLDGCPRCYEIFVEVVRIQRQLNRRGPLPVTPAPRSWRRVAAIVLPVVAAAALALFALTPLGDLFRGVVPAAGRQEERASLPPAAQLAAQLVASGDLAAQLGEAWDQQSWSVTRGLGGTDGGIERAFRLGVRLVDLEVALRLGEGERAIRLAHQTEDLLRGIELAQPLTLACRELRQRLEGGESPGALLELSALLDATVAEHPDVDPVPYSFGKWAEAGRLGALAGDAGFFRRREFQRTLAALMAGEWSEEVTGELQRIRDILQGGMDEEALERLERSFTAIIGRA